MKDCPFVLSQLQRRKLHHNNRFILPPIDTTKTIPDDLFDAAKDYLENNRIERYICQKYRMPRTDPRYLAYLPEELLIEYVADAIEDKRIELGVDGRPVRKIAYKDGIVTEIGDPEWDALEREWYDQDLEALRGASDSDDSEVGENLLGSIMK